MNPKTDSSFQSDDVSKRVLIVGGGIAGPVIAILLKQKGWQPIILEKVRNIGQSGIAIAVHCNGLKVLNQIGLATQLLSKSSPPWQCWQESSSTGKYLGGPASVLLAGCIDRYGWPCIGMSRTNLQSSLKQASRAQNIPYVEGWRIDRIEESESTVTVISRDGQRMSGSFVIGCDGIRSTIRNHILEKHGISAEEPDFSGSVVIAATTKTPDAFKATPGVYNFYGMTQTFISHPISTEESIWGLKLDGQADEEWKEDSAESVVQRLPGILKTVGGWPQVVQDMIANTQRMMTIGLFDRPPLSPQHWTHGRCVILGDAAHPATPHIGQGANQALEDCHHLARLLPEACVASTSALQASFLKYSTLREPSTTFLVKQARGMGERFVVKDESEEGRVARDALVQGLWNSPDMVQGFYDVVYSQPFEDLGGLSRAQGASDLVT